MKSLLHLSTSPRRFPWLATAMGILIISGSYSLSLQAAEGDEALPLGNPATIEHSTPAGDTEIAQRLIPFPFTPPDVKLKEKEPLSGSNDWFTHHDKKKIDELGVRFTGKYPINRLSIFSTQSHFVREERILAWGREQGPTPRFFAPGCPVC